MIEPKDEEMIHDLVEALPRLKQYRLTDSQRVFLEKLEVMLGLSKQNPSLTINEMIQWMTLETLASKSNAGRDWSG